MVYKKIRTYRRGYLDVGDGHKLYYDLSGNPKGKPVLFLHGGPGGGSSSKDKRFFNPKIFNIIIFDQRGSGESKPSASIENNTTFKLVGDIKKLLEFLGIKKVILFGGSWGSTLALVYAINYPETVKAMVIRGIFLGTEEDEDYFINQARYMYPEVWEEMTSLVPKNKRNNIEGYYFGKATSNNKKTRNKFLFNWAKYEFSISKLEYSKDKVVNVMKDIRIPAFSLIELYYLVNHCFLPKDYIMNNLHKIENIPVSIVHGRYDCVCIPSDAYKLHKALKKSRLYFTFGGHSASDKDTESRLVKEMDRFGKLKL